MSKPKFLLSFSISMKKLLTLFLSIYLFSTGFSQERLTTFGVTFKPMISGGLINEKDLTASDSGVTFSMDKAFGYNIGMVIRKGINKTFSIETGITYTQRRYNLTIEDPARSYVYKQELGVVGYEIPVLGLVYIQLDKNIYMDASFGGGLDFYPSDVAIFSPGNQVILEGKRNRWAMPFMVANIGWEYRTKESGTFYLGGTYHRTFSDIYGFLMQYDYNPNDKTINPQKLLITADGNYLTLDFRYFFHEDPEKRAQKKAKRKKR